MHSVSGVSVVRFLLEAHLQKPDKADTISIVLAAFV